MDSINKIMKEDILWRPPAILESFYQIPALPIAIPAIEARNSSQVPSEVASLRGVEEHLD